jgi:hypothetical protein
VIEEMTMSINLASYRDKAREFQTELVKEKYLHHAGLKEELEVEAIYNRHGDLFSDDAVRELAELHKKAALDDEKPLRHLLAFASDHALNAAVFEEDQQLASAISTASLSLGTQTFGFHEGAVLLANEKEPKRRQALFEERTRVIVGLHPIRAKRLAKIHQKARALFGVPFPEVYNLVTKVNLPVLKTQLENFLVASESYYSSHLERYANRILGRGLGNIEAWDVGYLFRGHEYDSLFPQDKTLSVLKRTLMGLGFDLKKLSNIVIDSSERPAKSAQALCFPVRVPEEVYLVLRPQGGVLDFLTLFHEAAHALHFGLTSAQEQFEFRFLGDPAVGETYGFLFEYLTLNEDWLQDFLKVSSRDTDFLEFNQFRKLYLLRRYAARFLFELTLHARDDADAPDLGELYSTTLKRALHVPVDPRTYLHDLEEAFYGTRFLRGWIFEAELRQILINRFGARWYSRPAAGDFLKEIWSWGFRYDCDELAGRIRRWGLNLDPITREVLK